MAALLDYRFVSLTPDQVQERRDLLSLRAQYAQLSALLVFILASVYARYTKSNGRIKSDGEKKKVKGWLDYPPVAGWGETRRQYLITGVWFMWMVALSMWRTGDGMFVCLLCSMIRSPRCKLFYNGELEGK